MGMHAAGLSPEFGAQLALPKSLATDEPSKNSPGPKEQDHEGKDECRARNRDSVGSNAVLFRSRQPRRSRCRWRTNSRSVPEKPAELQYQPAAEEQLVNNGARVAPSIS